MQDPSFQLRGLGASADGAWLADLGLAEFGLPGQLNSSDTDPLVALGLDASNGGPPTLGAWAGDAAAFADAAWPPGGSGSAEEGSGTALPASSSGDRLEKARAQNRAKQARFRQRQKVRAPPQLASFLCGVARLLSCASRLRTHAGSHIGLATPTRNEYRFCPNASVRCCRSRRGSWRSSTRRRRQTWSGSSS